MKHLFIDTNVLIDLILDRKPFNVEAVSVFKASENGQLHLYISALSIKDIYYLSRKTHSHERMLEIIDWLDQLTKIIPVSASDVRSAMRSEFTDYEDSLQHECARAEKKVEAIVTRNTKDFRKSALPVLTPAEALLQIG